MKAIFHPEASEETIGSARFYEARLEGLGADFLTAVADTTRRIEQFPNRTSKHPQATGLWLSFHNSLRNTA